MDVAHRGGRGVLHLGSPPRKRDLRPRAALAVPWGWPAFARCFLASLSGGANPGPTRISTRKEAKLGLQLDGIRPARWSYSRKKQGVKQGAAGSRPRAHWRKSGFCGHENESISTAPSWRYSWESSQGCQGGAGATGRHACAVAHRSQMQVTAMPLQAGLCPVHGGGETGGRADEPALP